MALFFLGVLIVFTVSSFEFQQVRLIIFIHQKGRNTYEEKKYSAFNRIYTTLFTNIHGSRNKKNNRKKERKKPNLVNMRFIYTLRF